MTMPGKPAFGGTVLRIPAIQSPDYVAGVSGWAIFQNGTVEFNSGTFRGTVTASTFQGTDFIINSQGAFFYSGAPAAGKLSASIVNGAGSVTDPFGNIALSGFTTYVVVGGTALAVNQALLNTTVFSSTSQAAGYASFITANAIGTAGSGGSLTNITQTLGGNIISLGGTATNVTDIETDTWHALPFVNGWGTNAATNGSYRLTTDNELEIAGEIRNTGVPTSATIATLLAPYVPVHLNGFAVGCSNSVNANATAWLQVDTAGVVSIQNVTLGNPILLVYGRIPLAV